MFPPTSKFSFMLICVESFELNDVPSILIAPVTMPPVPLPFKTKSAFDSFADIEFPEIVTWLPDKLMGKPLGY